MKIIQYNLPLPLEDPVLAAPSRCANAFRQIALGLLNDSLSDNPDIDGHYALLKDLFGLDRLQADLLSLFLARRIGIKGTAQAFGFLTDIPDSRIVTAWNSLMGKGLVRVEQDPATLEFGLAICPAFRIAIQQDSTLEKGQSVLFIEDFMTALKRVLRESQRSHDYDEDDGGPGSNPRIAGGSGKVKPYSPAYHADKCLELYAGSSRASQVKSLTEGLDESARLLLFGMMGWFSENFTKTVDDSSFSGALGQAYKKSLSTLLKKGLAVSVYEWDDKNNTAGCEHYRISPRCAELFKGQEKRFNLGVLSEYGTFTPPEQIEHKDLFFPEEDERGIHRINAAATPADYDRIITRLKERGYRPCLSVLMWGPPGTGKTELARQVARESGRGILIVDVPKLFGIFIGEGSIRLRSLFQTYRYVCAVSSVSPILFLDEADGILGQRITEIRRAADKDSNSCQSVILEELNSLPGLLFATTNLIGNLDQAMLRRFLIREEFHLPDAPTRALLWFSRFPGLTEQQAMDLAENYPLSGGIIDNIASMAVMDEILENRTITAEDLHSYCREQGLGMPRRNRIGF